MFAFSSSVLWQSPQTHLSVSNFQCLTSINIRWVMFELHFEGEKRDSVSQHRVQHDDGIEVWLWGTRNSSHLDWMKQEKKLEAWLASWWAIIWQIILNVDWAQSTITGYECPATWALLLWASPGRFQLGLVINMWWDGGKAGASLHRTYGAWLSVAWVNTVIGSFISCHLVGQSGLVHEARPEFH